MSVFKYKHYNLAIYCDFAYPSVTSFVNSALPRVVSELNNSRPHERAIQITRIPQSQFPSFLIAVAFGLAVTLSMAYLSLLGETDDTVSAQQQGTSQDLTLHSDNGAPRGIWSDGSTMWVADFSDRKLYAYALADGSRLADKDIALVSSIYGPRLWLIRRQCGCLTLAMTGIWITLG